MPFGYVPVARAGTVWSTGRRPELTFNELDLCSFYRVRDEYTFFLGAASVITGPRVE